MPLLHGRPLRAVVAAQQHPGLLRPQQRASRCLMRATLFDVPHSACDIDAADSAARQARVHAFLRQVQTVAAVVWLHEGMCDERVCRAARDGVFLYRDDGHLSHEGSAYLGRSMGFHRRLMAEPSLHP